MNTNLMFSSKTDLWSTPQDFFDKLNSEFTFTIAFVYFSTYKRFFG